METKTIQLRSGAVIQRIPIGSHDEKWVIKNKTLSTLYVTLNISACTGVIIKGYDDEAKVTECAAPMEEKTLFEILKTPPFTFKIGFDVREEALPIEDQNEYLKDAKNKITKIVSRMKDDIVQIPFEVLDTDQLTSAIKKFGHDHFVDPSFPPDDSSIYDKTNMSKYPLDEVAVWKRPSEFMRGRPRLFEYGIDPNDIRQGVLGDCWFLAAISSLAENPALVRRLFITKEYNEFGIYQLRICKNGEWVVVTIDDYIPCYIEGGPIFSHGQGNELWVMLLEKAYAKLHGNYWQLRYGYLSHGMMDLSGAPTKKYLFPNEREDYSKIIKFADKLWDTLGMSDEKLYIMCAETPGVDNWTEGGGPDRDHGIVPGHAYSVIKVREHKGVRLLNIRNPWGRFEWGGAWCDHHHHWTKEMIEAINPVFDSLDGSFWMSYQDFFKHFEGITI